MFATGTAGAHVYPEHVYTHVFTHFLHTTHMCAGTGDTHVYVLLYTLIYSAPPTACLPRGYGRAGTQNDRLGEPVVMSTGTSIPAR